MATMRELKGRINSVRSSQKITGAMKMISSARLRKAESLLLQSLPYRNQLQTLYGHVATADGDYESPFTAVREIKKVAIVIFASDDGLCGAFNISLYKKLIEAVINYKKQKVERIQVYPVGRKIVNEVRKINGIEVMKIPASFERKEYVVATKELADELMDKFSKGKLDHADVIFTYYKSMGSQIVTQQQFLPALPLENDKNQKKTWYIYEPDYRTVLDALYPLMLHAIMHESLLQNRTSEQAARILAMQMANDNAIKLLGNLQLEYNKLRQQGITSELLDIAGGTVR